MICLTLLNDRISYGPVLLVADINTLISSSGIVWRPPADRVI